MLFDDRLRDLLSAAQSIAIVGAKDRPGSPVEHVGRYLLEAGYRIFPVHPVRREVWGLPVWKPYTDAFFPPLPAVFPAAAADTAVPDAEVLLSGRGICSVWPISSA